MEADFQNKIDGLEGLISNLGSMQAAPAEPGQPAPQIIKSDVDTKQINMQLAKIQTELKQKVGQADLEALRQQIQSKVEYNEY